MAGDARAETIAEIAKAVEDLERMKARVARGWSHSGAIKRGAIVREVAAIRRAVDRLVGWTLV